MSVPGLLTLAGVRFHLRHPWQLALSLLGVALGVAVVVSMDLAIESARRGFDLARDAVFGRATHSIQAEPGGVDERLYARVRRLAPALASAPIVQGQVQTPGEAARTLTLIGLDPFAEPPFRDHASLGGSAAGVEAGDIGRLLIEPNTVAATDTTLRGLGVAVGDVFSVVAAGRPLELRVVARIEPRDEVTDAGLSDVLLTDIATAQESLQQIGTLSRIDLVVPSGRDAAALLARLRDALPPELRIEPSAARVRASTEMTRAFYLNLRMLSLLALVVGLFIVYNAMTFAVVQRRALIGTLRALGVTGRGVLAQVLVEALLLGAAGTALGLPAGVALASELVTLVTRTIDDLYFATAVREFTLIPAGALKGVLLGVLGSLLAAAVPALEATRVPPRAALTRSHLERRVHWLAPRLALAGGVVALLCPLLIVFADRSLGAAFAGLFCLVAAFTLWAPGATLLIARGLEHACAAASQRPARMAVRLAGLALRGLRASLSRCGVVVAALMVALATTVGVAVMVDSFRHSLRAWLDATLAADVYVALPGRGSRAGVDPTLIEAARRLPGVRAVTLSRDVEVLSAHGPLWLKAVSLDGAARYRGLQLLAQAEDDPWQALHRPDTVLVSEPLAWRRELNAGDSIDVRTARGLRALRVVGVYRDYGSDRGMLLMGIPSYRALFDDPQVSGVGLHLAPDASADTVVAELQSLSRGQALQVRSQRWIREASFTVFDRTFAITRVMRWLATLVACVGTMSALMALALERSREMAVLRAHGLTRRELMGMLQLQTGSMGLIAGLLSIPLGLALAQVLVHVINRRAFGWGMDFHVAPQVLVEALLLAVAAAMLAGLYPAWRMATTPAALALRED